MIGRVAVFLMDAGSALSTCKAGASNKIQGFNTYGDSAIETPMLVACLALYTLGTVQQKRKQMTTQLSHQAANYFASHRLRK
jgi:hypothetical protein